MQGAQVLILFVTNDACVDVGVIAASAFHLF